MVSTTVHLYKSDEFKIYIDRFVDEYILTIETTKGVINFTSNNLRDIEELIEEMYTAVQSYSDKESETA